MCDKRKVWASRNKEIGSSEVPSNNLPLLCAPSRVNPLTGIPCAYPQSVMSTGGA